jgi:hypothetical protein
MTWQTAVLADTETLEISLAASGPRTIFTISFQAGINNVSGIICGSVTCKVKFSYLQQASWSY